MIRVWLDSGNLRYGKRQGPAPTKLSLVCAGLVAGGLVSPNWTLTSSEPYWVSLAALGVAGAAAIL